MQRIFTLDCQRPCVYLNKNRLLPSSSSTDSSPQLANLILGENSTAEAKMINYWILLKGLLIRKKLANFHLIGGGSAGLTEENTDEINIFIG